MWEEVSSLGQVMQGTGAQDKDQGYHFSVKRRPWWWEGSGIKQGNGMMVYVGGEVEG